MTDEDGGGYPEEWDAYHPSEADEELFEPGGEDEPEIPTIDGQPAVVDHSDRGPDDFVISGPLGYLGGGHGRVFATVDEAVAWAVVKYGARRVRRVPPPAGFEEEATRWALLIKRS